MTNSKKESRWKRFGRLIKEARMQIIDPDTREPLQMKDAAERAGLSRVQWSRYENGASGVKLVTIPAIARALGRKSDEEIDEVRRWAGFHTEEESFQLPRSMKHYPDLSEEGQQIIARMVERLYTVEQQAKTKKRGK